VAYLGLVATQPSPVVLLEVLIQVTLLGAAAGGCLLLLRERQTHVDALAQATERSRRRAELLADVARTGRQLHTLDSGKALAEIVEAVCALGFDGAALCRFDEEHSTYEVALSQGLPPEFTGRTHWTAAGIPGLLGEDDTVIVTDYAASPDADPALVAAGFDTLVAAPVWRHGTHAAALLAAERGGAPAPPEAEVLAAFELLAGQSRLAIDNSRRFAEVQRGVKKLAEVDRLKSDFLATVSHELRTPLTVIQGVGRTLEMRWEGLGEARRGQLLVQLREHAQRLSRIVGAMLDFAALQLVERGRSEQVKLSVLLERCARRLGELLSEHNLIVDVEVGLEVTGDQALLERAVTSLLENAAQHTPPGTAVRLTAGLSHGLVTVAVVDDGPGVPSGAVPYLGERFYRASDPDYRGTEGLGLGLAVVREILRLHGSNLEVTSVEGEGSRFAFRLLPSAELPPEPARPLRRKPRATGTSRAAGARER
jgi:signal transduction histidine kinase